MTSTGRWLIRLALCTAASAGVGAGGAAVAMRLRASSTSSTATLDGRSASSPGPEPTGSAEVGRAASPPSLATLPPAPTPTPSQRCTEVEPADAGWRLVTAPPGVTLTMLRGQGGALGGPWQEPDTWRRLRYCGAEGAPLVGPVALPRHASVLASPAQPDGALDDDARAWAASIDAHVAIDCGAPAPGVTRALCLVPARGSPASVLGADLAARATSLVLLGNDTDADLAVLRGAPVLRALSIASRAFTNRGLAGLGPLPALEELDLEGSRVATPGVRSLAAHGKLRSLSLARTEVSDASFGALRALPLVALSIADNPLLSDAATPTLAAVTTLRALAISGTAISDAGLATLTRLDLTALDVRGTRITDAGLTGLARTPRLVWLDASALGVARLAWARALRELRYLRLADNPIADADLAPLVGVPTLELLDLARTRITDAALPTLAASPALRWIDVSGTAVTAAGCAAWNATGRVCTRDDADDADAGRTTPAAGHAH